ncbi:MAG: sulfatase [Firmicutes bacterium]|nr:sulfatase [Bacillota bacterium]
MNVIVIVADSLRADHVGCYGSRVKTPNIDRLARESALFEEAYSENLPTLPCRTSWWTGLYLFTLRGWQHFEPWDYTLAEVLWDQGMTSCLVSDTYHMHKPVYNCGRGFDTVVWVRGQEYDHWIMDDSIKVDIDTFHRLKGDSTDDMWRQRFVQYMRNRSWYKTEEDWCLPRVIKEAIRWLENVTKKQKDRIFLWVDSFDPHEPWDPPSPFREMYDPEYKGQELIDPIPGPIEGYMTHRELEHTKALYAGEVSFVDKWVGILLDRIRELGIYDNSLIMFTSDHGEPFGEHGIIRKALPWNYEELAHIPWLIRHPEGWGAGKRFPAFVQPPDLMPTILDALRIDRHLELPFLAPVKLTFPQDIIVSKREIDLDGKSLLPIMRGEVESIRDFAVTAHHNAQWGIRTRDWTYLHPVDPQWKPEFYNRRQDRGEQHNLISSETEVADALELKLRRFAEAVHRKNLAGC